MSRGTRFVLLTSIASTLLVAAPAGAVDRSTGLYVIPYEPGTKVHVTNDHASHSPPNRIDMSGREGTGTYEIVAAAPGTIRYIQDSFSEARPGQDPCNNNYVWIQHANGEWTKYSHMEQFSTTEEAGLDVGDQVDAGEFLGYENDVGCASGNHLHFEVGVPANPADPIDSQGFLRGGSNENRIPRICGIPGQQFVKNTDYVVGDITPGGTEYALHGVPEASYQKLWEQARDCEYRLVWLDGYTDDGDLEFNLVFRNNSPSRAWASKRRMTGTQYQDFYDDYKAQGYRLVHVDSYVVGGAVRYGAIWEKRSGPKLAAYHGLSATEHQDRLEDLTAKGYRPSVLSSVTVGGTRRITAIYLKQAVGSWEARSFLTPSEYQSKYNANKAAGRHLVYLNAYTHDGSPRFTAIWWKSPPAKVRAQHGMSAVGYQNAYDDNTGDGFLTQAVTGYEQGGNVRYAAFWAR